MATLTITEALAEIKTNQKRIVKKREFIGGYLFRQNHFRDPLESEGGSRAAIEREMQAIGDLEQQIVRIRAAIQKANQRETMTVLDRTQTIGDWLTWRREISKDHQVYLASLRQNIDRVRKDAATKAVNVVAGNPPAAMNNDLIINLDEQALAKEIESLETILGTLDGQLSLKNATTMVEY